jgi:hypothetical protein
MLQSRPDSAFIFVSQTDITVLDGMINSVERLMWSSLSPIPMVWISLVTITVPSHSFGNWVTISPTSHPAGRPHQRSELSWMADSLPVPKLGVLLRTERPFSPFSSCETS